jgi:hypothetical protein
MEFLSYKYKLIVPRYPKHLRNMSFYYSQFLNCNEINYSIWSSELQMTKLEFSCWICQSSYCFRHRSEADKSQEVLQNGS